MLDVERLRALHAVANHGSVRAAAEALHVTTSAVSQQVAKLERETGQVMLERHGRGVRLTDAAELLAEHADGILSLIEQAASDLEAIRGAAVGELTIATFPTAARGLLAPALRRLAQSHPKLEIRLREMEPQMAVMLVERGQYDMAIVQDWFNVPLAIPDGLAKASIIDDQADVAVPPEHPLAERDRVDLDELAAEPWISQSPGAICRDWLVHTLRSRNVEPWIAHTADEYATQLTLVAAGLGISVLPRLGRCDVPPGVRFIEVRPALTRHVYAIWRQEAARRPAIRVTVEALRAVASPEAPDADQALGMTIHKMM
jgi:DNA-binding transcriptional LysR family regulator